MNTYISFYKDKDYKFIIQKSFMIEISTLEYALQNAWNKETSVKPSFWTPQNNALGQSIPTVLVVQDYCGGDILKTRSFLLTVPTTRITHYYNSVNDIIYDFTKSQYPNGITQGESTIISRKTLLSSTSISQKYKTLKERVENIIKNIDSI